MTNAIYNIGVGAAGVDPTQHNREMSPLERTARVVGGAVTAVGVSRGLGGTTSADTAMEAEAVTAEGVRVRVPHTDEPLATTNIEARAKSEVGGRRNVEAHEAAGGHTAEMHVSKSETWLRNRLETDPALRDTPFASSFRNEAAANRVQAQFRKQFRAEIESWLKSGSTEPFKAKIDMSDPVGIVVQRGRGGAVETSKAFAMLVRDNSRQGWHFHTSYPVTK